MTSTSHPGWIILASATVALIPIAVGMVTSYVKVSVVLSMIRSALGTQSVPSGLVIMALSLSLTFYIMSPVLTKTAEIGETLDTATIFKTPSVKSLKKLAPILEPWREFMTNHSGKRELMVLANLHVQEQNHLDGGVSGMEIVALQAQSSIQPVPFRTLIPAFVLTELKEGFAMGFVVLLPFLVIDIIVANVLVGMGMMMVSPVLISLPLKLLLLVVSDGWILIVKGLVQSYGV